jgi:hypothetical protein
MKQALWPQCQGCFQKQGTAVRLNRHDLIYNTRLRLHHLAVLCGVTLAENDIARDFFHPLVEQSVSVIEAIRKYIN